MLCKQCPAFASLANVEMTGASGCQLVVDLLDYLIMKYPTPLVSVHFDSVIPTFCSILV